MWGYFNFTSYFRISRKLAWAIFFILYTSSQKKRITALAKKVGRSITRKVGTTLCSICPQLSPTISPTSQSIKSGNSWIIDLDKPNHLPSCFKQSRNKFFTHGKSMKTKIISIQRPGRKLWEVYDELGTRLFIYHYNHVKLSLVT